MRSLFMCHSPNFHIHVSVSDLYNPKTDLPILLQDIWGPILGIYKSLTDTWMWKLGLRSRNSQKKIHKWNCRCSVPRRSTMGTGVEYRFAHPHTIVLASTLHAKLYLPFWAKIVAKSAGGMEGVRAIHGKTRRRFTKRVIRRCEI
jgi:hypothetical protein